jgi:uncharacterized protein (DUF885 family)
MRQDSGAGSERADARPVRELADGYVHKLAELDPLTATYLGLPVGLDRLPDFSPAGIAALEDLTRRTLAQLEPLEAGPLDEHERRCARLLRDRLESELAVSESGEYLRFLSNIDGACQRVQQIFTLMPTATADDWAMVAQRMAKIPAALAGHRASLTEGAGRRLLAAPRQVDALIGTLAEWLADSDGTGWFAAFAASADVLAELRSQLDAAASAAQQAVADLRDWLQAEYLPQAAGTPDGVGVERYRRWARLYNGATLDLAETYQWGWSQYIEIWAQMQAEAGKVLPGSTPLEAMRYLDEHGEAVDGVDAVQDRLQQIMNEAISELSETHFDLADPIKVVEARIAPAGSAAAPYYTAPSQDFARPGQTWLPTLGQTRFPLWSLLSTWYHEGVPGHHLQLAQWVYVADRLSMFQTSVGGVSANIEGWALYAERLMDELGYFTSPGVRLGFLDCQLLRAIRVVIDIGMHLELAVPADSPIGTGQTWTAELAREFFGAHSGHPADFIDSEIVRYLGTPGQAIGYKVGERAWLAGRAAARAARESSGEPFDLKAWHMAALSLGSLGLDDLTDELARL